MLNYLKIVVNYLSFDFSAYSYLIVVALVSAFIIISLVEVFRVFFSKSKINVCYYVFYSFINVILVCYFTFEDFLGEKLLFVSTKNVYSFLTANLLLSTLILFLTYAVTNKKKLVKEPIVLEKVKIENEMPLPEKTQNCSDVFKGYINVSYLKSLLEKLKQKQLSDSDYREIEDFEVYILNFVSRQPNGEERKVLSERLSTLIKKMAKYEV